MSLKTQTKSKSQLKLLFITRKFPPSVGGMEKVSYDLYRALSEKTEISLISWGRTQKWLPLFLPFAFFKSVCLITSKKLRIVYLADGLLSPLGLLLKTLLRTKVVVTAHGLDITYANRLYQWIVPYCLKRLDKIVAVSNATIAEGVKRGIPQEKFTFIPNGINPDELTTTLPKGKIRGALEKELDINLKNKFILLTIGRLVERKGHEWFIKNVIPGLPQNTIYLIAGAGEQEDEISDLISNLGLESRVYLLGRVSKETKINLFNAADLFVMPNIKIPGDMEGFGIVALEARSVGLPVIASDIEGIKDAVGNYKNGYLIKSKDSHAFTETILNLIKSPSVLKEKSRSAKQFSSRFDWDKISKLYLQVFNRTLNTDAAE